MLIAIDLQNDTFAESGSSYNERANRIKHRITGRINKADAENESIIYTKNLYPDFEHRNRTTDSIRFDEGIHPVVSDLLYKYGDEYVKTFYGIPPEEAQKIQEKYIEEVETKQTIEFIGIETNLCIPAHIMIIHNIFPYADITVAKELVASSNSHLHDKTLETLSNMRVTIK